MGDYVAYYRVSTRKQGTSGLGLEAQQDAARRYVASANPIIPRVLVAEFTEVESGKRSNRPQLAAALAECKRSKATLIIAKLDRLARNVKFIATLMDGDVEFIALDMPFADRLMIHILAAIAEHEARMVSERTKAALAAAKARGVRLGNRPGAIVTPNVERMKRADAFAAQVMHSIDDMRARGVLTLHGLARGLNERGLKTSSGSTWDATRVRRVISRVQGAGVAS